MFSSRNKSQAPKDYYIVRGRAYPSVIRGSNPTDRIDHDSLTSRQKLYHHPAVKLSDDDLDKFNGTEGYPLCIEHKPHKVVGRVHHAWIGEGKDRALEIIGRISTKTELGRKTVAKIQAKKYRGFSVSYGAGIEDAGKGTAKLNDKMFREISICKEPFFSGCDIKLGIAASKNETYKSDTKFYVELIASENISMSDQAASQPPASQDGELLKQADSLKEQVNEAQARVAELEKERREKAELQEKLAKYEKYIKAEEEAYAKEQMPKANEYITALEASIGRPLAPKIKEGYINTFCSKAMRDGADMLWAQHQNHIKLEASRKEAESRLEAAEKEKKDLMEQMNKATNAIKHSRKGFSDALEQKPVEEKRLENLERNIPLNHIMCSASAHELPFLKAFGFATDVEIAASAGDADEELRPMVKSIPKAPTHRLLLDPETKERNFPNSARYYPSGEAWFSFMCSNEELATGNLSGLVQIQKSQLEKKDHSKEEMKTYVNTSGGDE